MEKRNKKIILTLAVLILITVFLGIPSFYQDITISIFALLIIVSLYCNLLNKKEVDDTPKEENDQFSESQPVNESELDSVSDQEEEESTLQENQEDSYRCQESDTDSQDYSQSESEEDDRV